MDIDMTDAGYDIDLGVDASVQNPVQQFQQPVQESQTKGNDGDDAPMPAAYFESLEVFEPWPQSLNLQGVSDFGPNDPLDYALEHCPELGVKRLRWVNDNSVNLEYYNAKDAAEALSVLTDSQAGDHSSIDAQTSRQALSYSKRPDSILAIRECNSGDQKAKNAAVRSQFYKKNPQARDQTRDREGGHRRQRDYLDYDEVDATRPKRRSASFDESMYDDNVSSSNDIDNGRDGWNNNRDRNVRNREVDSYRPGPRSRARESDFGRLRDRSASPSDDGDGRLGFAEDGSSLRRRYRSRSRSRSRNRNDRRRRAPSSDRWTHDRSVEFSDRDHGDSGGRWLKNSELPKEARATLYHKVDMGSNHRRSDATDETANKGSLLSRMTKNGQPLTAPRSLASRITRDDGESSFGRLKDDNSMPQHSEFAELEPPKRDLASRITRNDDDDNEDDFNIRGRSQGNGFSIRGTAVAQTPSFSIRGAAGGA